MPFKDLDEVFHIYAFIGSGTYGDVYEVSNKKTKESYAIKISYLVNDSFINPINLREIANILKFSHHNIIKYYDVDYGLFKGKKCIYILLELCDYALFNGLHIKHNINDLFDAISYLHDNNYYHGDLSFSNVLVSKNTLKLIDFGTTRRTYRPYDSEMPPTLIVRPIELFDAPSNNSNINGKKMDYWSLGCIMYKLLTNEYIIDPCQPNNININSIKQKCKGIHKNSKINGRQKEQLVGLLDVNYRKRKLQYKNRKNYMHATTDNHFVKLKQNSLFSSIDDSIKINIVLFLNNVIKSNNLEEELLFLTINNAKKISIRQNKKNGDKVVTYKYLILFWLANHMISLNIISFDDLKKMLNHFDLPLCQFNDLYFSVIKELNWDIDQDILYNYIGYFEDTMKIYYKGLILFLELSNYNKHKITDTFFAIYNLFKKNHHFCSVKIEEMINNYKFPIINSKTEIITHIKKVMDNSEYHELNQFIKYYFNADNMFHIYVWITNLEL